MVLTGQKLAKFNKDIDYGKMFSVWGNALKKMVNVNILVCIPPCDIYADLIVTVLCKFSKIILLASDRS